MSICSYKSTETVTETETEVANGKEKEKEIDIEPESQPVSPKQRGFMGSVMANILSFENRTQTKK